MSLAELLERHVATGALPGAVALVARGDDAEVAVVGVRGTDAAPMRRDSLFRIASISKPITAAAAMLLVEDGTIGLEDPIGRWLPELAAPMVARKPDAALDDVVPAQRPITVRDLQTFRAGWGYPADFSLPIAELLSSTLRPGPSPLDLTPDEVIASIAAIPLLQQPGEAWFYNTCSDILSVLVARASGLPFAEFLAERIFTPLGMTDTSYWVPADRRDRYTEFFSPGPPLTVIDRVDGDWSAPPRFAGGAGQLISTVDDWWAFGRMLLSGDLLSRESIELMTTDHLTAAQRDAAALFLEGQGWGFGGSVDVAQVDPWNSPGRYGWVGGTGTAAHIVPAEDTITILLTQVGMTSPESLPLMREFWSYTAAD